TEVFSAGLDAGGGRTADPVSTGHSSRRQEFACAARRWYPRDSTDYPRGFQCPHPTRDFQSWPTPDYSRPWHGDLPADRGAGVRNARERLLGPIPLSGSEIATAAAFP